MAIVVVVVVGIVEVVVVVVVVFVFFFEPPNCQNRMMMVKNAERRENTDLVALTDAFLKPKRVFGCANEIAEEILPPSSSTSSSPSTRDCNSPPDSRSTSESERVFDRKSSLDGLLEVAVEPAETADETADLAFPMVGWTVEVTVAEGLKVVAAMTGAEVGALP